MTTKATKLNIQRDLGIILFIFVEYVLRESEVEELPRLLCSVD